MYLSSLIDMERVFVTYSPANEKKVYLPNIISILIIKLIHSPPTACILRILSLNPLIYPIVMLKINEEKLYRF